jgi:hypothetical protein
VFDPGCADGQDPLLRSFFPLVPAAEWVCHVHAACPVAGAGFPGRRGESRPCTAPRKTERPLAVEIRDRLGQWLADEDFAAAFGFRGRPGWASSRLALVTVLQRAEKLTDWLAAEAVRARLDWKYLLGLSLGDPGFDDTVLAEFRGKVAGRGWSRWRWTRCWPGWPPRAWSRRAGSSAPNPRTWSRRWRR